MSTTTFTAGIGNSNWANGLANTPFPRQEPPLITKSVTDVREPVAIITVMDMLKAVNSRTWPGTVVQANTPPGTITRSQPPRDTVEVECAFRIRAIISSDDLLRMRTLLKLRGEL